MIQRHLIDTDLVAQLDEEDLFDYFYDQQGSIPGTLKIDKNAPQPEIILIDYNEAERTRVPLKKPEDCLPYLDTDSVSWVDVRGLGSEDVLQRLGKVFNRS